MELLRTEQLTFRYPNAGQDALQNISLEIEDGSFSLLCGASGCGKTTLLRLLKRELAPVGEKSGRILLRKKEQDALSPRESAGMIGFVRQNPEQQIVTDKVWHELAFGLENLGLPTGVIRRRVGEMASYFGIQDWFRQDTATLSGGQKQLLNLAAIMVMQPELLILDEPTSQLDPIAASEFIATLRKLNRELGLTILLTEHRLEEVFPIADQVIVMEQGRVLLCGTPRAVGRSLPADHPITPGLPSAVRIFGALNFPESCPLTVREGRNMLEAHFSPVDMRVPDHTHSEKAAIELKNVWFRYEKSTPDILRGISLQIWQGECCAILGGNGAGKTTALQVIAGLQKAYHGKVLIDGKPIREYRNGSLYRNKLALLPQDPQTVFIKDTVRNDLADLLTALGIPVKAQAERIIELAEKLEFTHLLERHPYDLSGGEQQRCALAKVLLSKPTILLLDEPTKGLDAGAKQSLGRIMRNLREDGMTVLMVTHDVEFAAESADRCALFFDGEILSMDTPAQFFAENNFYTTAANRMARRLFPYAVTCDAVINCCKGAEKP